MATSPNSGCPSVRVIIQQCLSARLQVQPPTENEDAQWVEVSGTHENTDSQTTAKAHDKGVHWPIQSSYLSYLDMNEVIKAFSGENYLKYEPLTASLISSMYKNFGITWKIKNLNLESNSNKLKIQEHSLIRLIMLNPCIILSNLVIKNISEGLKYTVAHASRFVSVKKILQRQNYSSYELSTYINIFH